jgi:hypothetical protein
MNKDVIGSVVAEGTETVKQEGDIIVKKPYEFRQLCAKDIPLVTNVIKSIGVKEFKSCLNKEVIDEIKQLFKKDDKKDSKKDSKTVDYTTVGITALPLILDIAEVVLNNVEKCATALFKLLSSTSNLSVEEVENLSLADFTDMVFDFIRKDEFPDFFKVVLKLLRLTK